MVLISSKPSRCNWLVYAAAVAGLALPFSAASQPVLYGGAHLGMNNMSSWPAQVNFGGVTSTGRLSLDDSAHGGLMFGRQTENARFELEYQQGRIEISSAQLGPITQATDARGKYQVLMLNAYRTFLLRPNFNAFLGAGIGWGSVKLPALPPISGCNCFPAASDKGVTFQARVGAEYLMQGGHGLFLQYTALRLPGADSGGVPSVDYSRRTISAITAGYRKTF